MTKSEVFAFIRDKYNWLHYTWTVKGLHKTLKEINDSPSKSNNIFYPEYLGYMIAVTRNCLKEKGYEN